MATKKKLLQAAAGSAGGAGLNVEDVFSTYLYKGTDANNITATTGIDMSGEGGMVWFKGRSATEEGTIVDSARGVDYAHYTPQTSAHFSISGLGFSAPTFTSTGFTVGDMPVINRNTTDDYAAWSFRKAPKFFDVVTWTGDGSGDWDTREISHNLGSTPGFIIIKRTDSADDWWCAAKKSSTQYAISTNGATNPFGINTTNSAGAGSISDCATDTVFMPGFIAQTSDANVNNANYVAYLFAHNDGDGDFGPDADADIIKCGSYTGDGTTNGTNEVTLGWEPQWILTKRSDSADNWHICDVMRGQTTDGVTARLIANTSAAESSSYGAVPTATGFKLYSDNSNGGTFIYMAIRRGPMAVPESATDVFDINYRDTTKPHFNSTSSVVDMAFKIYTLSGYGDSWKKYIQSRLTGTKHLQTNSTGSEGSNNENTWDHHNGWSEDPGSSDYFSWMWKRAPNYFDVVAYTGTGVAGQSHNHNLGVAPEMIWIKNRDSATSSWQTLHKLSDGTHVYGVLNNTAALNSAVQHKFGDGTNFIAPTATQFSVINNSAAGSSGANYIAYLFASVDGISKVGSYTGNGTSTGDAQNIDCGFSSGARFVLIKATSVAYGWMLFDTERGITSGNDSLLLLNDTDAETTAFDSVDPYSSGFTAVQGPYNVNQNGVSYIFYAIA